MKRSRCLYVAALAILAIGRPAAQQPESVRLYDRGRTFEEFLRSVTANRDVWARVTADATVPGDLVDRFRRAAGNLRLLVVAEDWCADSMNTVPYIAALAKQAGTELRIVGRTAGAAVMRRHPAADGRGVTPVVVLLRARAEEGAWVGRPAVLQSLFRAIGTDALSAERFARRQTWYDQDRGRTTLSELVAVAERRTVDGRR